MSPYALPPESHLPQSSAVEFDSQCLVQAQVDQATQQLALPFYAQISVSRVVDAPAQKLHNKAWVKLNQQFRGNSYIYVELTPSQHILPNSHITIQLIEHENGSHHWRLYDEHLLKPNA